MGGGLVCLFFSFLWWLLIGCAWWWMVVWFFAGVLLEIGIRCGAGEDAIDAVGSAVNTISILDAVSNSDGGGSDGGGCGGGD